MGSSSHTPAILIMTYPGAAPPPPGFTPDLDNPDSMLRTVNYATQSLTLLFTTLFIVTRFYAKWKVLGGGVTMDDCEFFLPNSSRHPSAPREGQCVQ